MKFINDPTLADLAPVGSGAPVLVAPRTRSGEAYFWRPGGDAQALVDFIGQHKFVSVAGEVYQRMFDGTLQPFDVKQDLVVVRPPAGEPFFLTPDEFKQEFARVDGPSSASDFYEQMIDKLHEPEPDIARVWLNINEGAEKLAEAGTMTMEQVRENVLAQIAGAGDTETGQESVQPDPAPPAVKADPMENPPAPKRPPGRPKGSTNKPKAAV